MDGRAREHGIVHFLARRIYSTLRASTDRRMPRVARAHSWQARSPSPEPAAPRRRSRIERRDPVQQRRHQARVSPAAAPRPITTPMPASTKPCRTNILNSPCCAPSAARMPISRRRCETV